MFINRSNNVIESRVKSVPEDVYSPVRCKSRGFSLLEVIIALAIMGFLLGGVAVVVETGRNFDHYAENKRYMNQVHDSLLTFVKVNGFLPCPDTDNPPDGQENRDPAALPACQNANGVLPYLDLGVSATDVWNQPLRYAVNRQADNNAAIADPLVSASYFNNQPQVVPGSFPQITGPFFNFNTAPIGGAQGVGNFNICGETTPAAAQCNANNNNPFVLEEVAIAVVVSFGMNGADTWNRINTGVNAGLDAAEAENIDDTNLEFWQAAGSNVPGQAFDDQLIWLTGYDVKYAVLTSGGVLQ